MVNNIEPYQPFHATIQSSRKRIGKTGSYQKGQTLPAHYGPLPNLYWILIRPN